MSPDVIDNQGKVNNKILDAMDNRIFVYTKGADNVIIDRLKNK